MLLAIGIVFTAKGQSGKKDYRLQIYVKYYDSINPGEFKHMDSAEVCALSDDKQTLVCRYTDSTGFIKSAMKLPGNIYTFLITKKGYDSVTATFDLAKTKKGYLLWQYPKSLKVGYGFSRHSNDRDINFSVYHRYDSLNKKHSVRLVPKNNMDDKIK